MVYAGKVDLSPERQKSVDDLELRAEIDERVFPLMDNCWTRCSNARRLGAACIVLAIGMVVSVLQTLTGEYDGTSLSEYKER